MYTPRTKIYTHLTTLSLHDLLPIVTLLQNMLIPHLAKRDGAFRLNAWGRVDRQGEVTGKAEHLLEDVGLIDKKNVKADYLSRGDKRRLELAMCLVQDPKLLLLDEPTAGMSRADTNDTIDLLKRIGDRRIPKIVIEHDMHVVFSLAHRLSWMAPGGSTARGPERKSTV